VSATDDLLAGNARYAEQFDLADLPAPPARHVTVVVCMDARIDIYRVLGLQPGDAHVLRNAGGIVTEDVVRSLALSQRLLGTEEVLVVQHTRCGLHGLDGAAFLADVEADTGTRPDFDPGGFDDLDASVRASLERLRSEPALPQRDRIRGFVYDVATGQLREVR
jgi:carbonic anhydrase